MINTDRKKEEILDLKRRDKYSYEKEQLKVPRDEIRSVKAFRTIDNRFL